MTQIEVGTVDVFVIEPRTHGWRVLALQRVLGTRCPGAWETVHGHIEPGEQPEDAAVRAEYKTPKSTASAENPSRTKSRIASVTMMYP